LLYYKEIKYKKITDEEKNELNKNEESCYKIMEAAIDQLNQRFSPLRKTLSPNVAKVQMHMNVFEDRNKKDIKLASNGFLNYNLCLNAKTEDPHTECDSSYTVITVPNQMRNGTIKGYKNCGSFEFIINSQSTIVIPMKIGTNFAYSGYLLTHRQQIRNEDESEYPFINIVSYNSKRLFENIMESFRRYTQNT